MINYPGGWFDVEQLPNNSEEKENDWTKKRKRGLGSSKVLCWCCRSKRCKRSRFIKKKVWVSNCENILCMKIKFCKVQYIKGCDEHYIILCKCVYVYKAPIIPICLHIVGNCEFSVCAHAASQKILKVPPLS